MTPRRRPGRGAMLRVDIDWTRSLGFRIQCSAETTSKRERDALVDLLYQLRSNGQVEVLRAFADGKVPVALLRQFRRQGRLSSDTLASDLALLERLWHNPQRCPIELGTGHDHTRDCLGAVDRLLPQMGKGPETTKRYATSFRKLRQVAVRELPDDALVQHLTSVDWSAVREEWHGSAADWNHMRRAVSRLLSVLLGHPHHATRLSAVGRIPIATEVPRTPELTARQFWALMRRVPEHARPCYFVLAATMMRLGEYLRCGEKHLDHERFAVRVPGTKTERSQGRVVTVGEEAWPWIIAGIPSPLQEKRLRLYWQEACVALGLGERVPQLDDNGEPVMVTHTEYVRVPGQRKRQRREVLVQATRYEGMRLHDLRHVGGQLALDGGAQGDHVQDAMGQTDSRVTRIYTRRQNAAVAGRAAAGALLANTDERTG